MLPDHKAHAAEIERRLGKSWQMLVDYRVDRQTQEQIAHRYGLHQSSVCRRLKRAERVLREMGGRL